MSLRVVIYANVFENMHELCKAVDSFQLTYEYSINFVRKSLQGCSIAFLPQINAKLIETVIRNSEHMICPSQHVQTALRQLWKDSAIRDVYYNRRSKLKVMDNCCM